MSRFQNPLPLAQRALIAAPHLASLIAITCVCFAIGSIGFMR
jgi:hypothetical protein